MFRFALARDFVERALHYEMDAETAIQTLPGGLVFDVRDVDVKVHAIAAYAVAG